MDDIRSTMTKADSKDKPKIEAAMGKYCANEDDKLSAKEKKICYYIDPMYVMLHMPLCVDVCDLLQHGEKRHDTSKQCR
jgi:hypothetical protein